MSLRDSHPTRIKPDWRRLPVTGNCSTRGVSVAERRELQPAGPRPLVQAVYAPPSKRRQSSTGLMKRRLSHLQFRESPVPPRQISAGQTPRRPHPAAHRMVLTAPVSTDHCQPLQSAGDSGREGRAMGSQNVTHREARDCPGFARFIRPEQYSLGGCHSRVTSRRVVRCHSLREQSCHDLHSASLACYSSGFGRVVGHQVRLGSRRTSTPCHPAM